MPVSYQRLPNGQPIVTTEGFPTLAFTVYWQQLLQALEKQNAAQDKAIADIAAAQAAADTAQKTANAYMPDVLPTTVAADYSGAILAGQLPRNIAVKRFNGMVDVSASSTWTAATVSGSADFTIGAATGIISLTGLGASSVLEATSVHNGITLKRQITVNKQLGSAPSGSGGGTSASDTTMNGISAATMANISDELTVTVGSTGVVTLSAPLDVYTGGAAPTGTFEVFGIWQWDSTGAGAWVDLGTEIASDPDVLVYVEGGLYYLNPGALSVSASKTGLAPASSQKFRLRARNSAGTRAMTFAGTARAVGS